MILYTLNPINGFCFLFLRPTCIFFAVQLFELNNRRSIYTIRRPTEICNTVYILVSEPKLPYFSQARIDIQLHQGGEVPSLVHFTFRVAEVCAPFTSPLDANAMGVSNSEAFEF